MNISINEKFDCNFFFFVRIDSKFTICSKEANFVAETENKRIYNARMPPLNVIRRGRDNFPSNYNYDKFRNLTVSKGVTRSL